MIVSYEDPTVDSLRTVEAVDADGGPVAEISTISIEVNIIFEFDALMAPQAPKVNPSSPAVDVGDLEDREI